jgi:hypothetical protein
MDMKRLLVVLLLVAACNKPSNDNCRKALLNAEKLLGLDALTSNPGELEGEVRRCTGASTKKSVECAMNATTIADLRGCNFVKGNIPQTVTPKPTSNPTPAPGSAGSAVTDTTGSAAAPEAGSGTGSASSTAMGSGTGSASSTATGSGTGSAHSTGTHAGSGAGSGKSASAGSGAGSGKSAGSGH